MESTRKQSKKADNQPSESKIKSAYRDHLLQHGTRPASVYKFCLDIGIREEDFYNFFGSFDGIERQIWKDFIQKTTTKLKADEAFGLFTAREQILSFYFALIEELRSSRSFILLQMTDIRQTDIAPPFLKEFRSSFEQFIGEILNAGKGKGEIANRPWLDEKYPRLFWLHMVFILRFWRDDDSAGFEKTDAAIEKSVNLAFDLISKGAVDTAFDFGKFLFQNR
jgi:AcrR family transcriptional regulator